MNTIQRWRHDKYGGGDDMTKTRKKTTTKTETVTEEQPDDDEDGLILARFMVEKNSLMVTSPSGLRGKHDTATEKSDEEAMTAGHWKRKDGNGDGLGFVGRVG